MAYNQQEMLNTIAQICATNPAFAQELAQIANGSQKTSANSAKNQQVQNSDQTVVVQQPVKNNLKTNLLKGYGLLGAAGAFSSIFFSYALGGSAFSFLGLTGLGASFALGGVVAGAFVIGLPLLALTGKLVWSGIKKLGGKIGTSIKSFFTKLKINRKARKAARKQNQARRRLALVKSNILKENSKMLKKQDKNAWKMIANFNKDVIKASKKYNLVYIKASALGKRKDKNKWYFALISKKPDKNGNWILYSPFVGQSGGKKLLSARTFDYGKNIRTITIDDYFQNELDKNNFLIKEGLEKTNIQGKKIEKPKGEAKVEKETGTEKDKDKSALPQAAGEPKVNLKPITEKQAEEIDKSTTTAVPGATLKELTAKQIDEVSEKIQKIVALAQTLEKYPEEKAKIDAQIKAFVDQLTQAKKEINQTGDINQKLDAQAPSAADDNIKNINKPVSQPVNQEDSPVNTPTPEPVRPQILANPDGTYKLKDPETGELKNITPEQKDEIINQYQADKQAYIKAKEANKLNTKKEDKKRK